MPLESTIVNNILGYLNNKVDNCVAEKVHGNAFQVGRPDINGCWRGRNFRIEVKSRDHGNKPTKIQELNLKRWAQTGSICFVAYCLEDVQALINNELSIYVDTFGGTIYPREITEQYLLTLSLEEKSNVMRDILKGFAIYDNKGG